MSTDWRSYQENVAAVFRQMGFNANVEVVLSGARGNHEVDVVVHLNIAGVPVTWVIECKYWKSPVNKAAVLTLIQVAQDVGADRAFLLSERGFQAGAIASTKHSNVTLSSIGELEAAAKSHIAETSIRSSLERVKQYESALRELLYRQKLTTPPQGRVEATIDLLGVCLDATLSATAALTDQYPVRIPCVTVQEDSEFSNEPMKIASALQAVASYLETATGELSKEIEQSQKVIPERIEQFIDQVRALLSACGELQSASAVNDADESVLMGILAIMRNIGNERSKIDVDQRTVLAEALGDLMRELIDGVYLWVGNPVRNTEHWPILRDRVQTRVSRITDILESSA